MTLGELFSSSSIGPSTKNQTSPLLLNLSCKKEDTYYELNANVLDEERTKIGMETMCVWRTLWCYFCWQKEYNLGGKRHKQVDKAV
jgi:hypothetical protein